MLPLFMLAKNVIRKSFLTFGMQKRMKKSAKNKKGKKRASLCKLTKTNGN